MPAEPIFRSIKNFASLFRNIQSYQQLTQLGLQNPNILTTPVTTQASQLHLEDYATQTWGEMDQIDESGEKLRNCAIQKKTESLLEELLQFLSQISDAQYEKIQAERSSLLSPFLITHFDKNPPQEYHRKPRVKRLVLE